MNTTKTENPWDELRNAIDCRDLLIEDKKLILAFEKSALPKISKLKKEIIADFKKATNGNGFYDGVIEEKGLDKIGEGSLYRLISEDWNDYLKDIVSKIASMK